MSFFIRMVDVSLITLMYNIVIKFHTNRSDNILMKREQKYA